jgi:hypothetical protein
MRRRREWRTWAGRPAYIYSGGAVHDMYAILCGREGEHAGWQRIVAASEAA